MNRVRSHSGSYTPAALSDSSPPNSATALQAESQEGMGSTADHTAMHVETHVKPQSPHALLGSLEAGRACYCYALCMQWDPNLQNSATFLCHG
jgi:hypothetical protein